MISPAGVSDVPELLILDEYFHPKQRWSEAMWQAELGGEHRLVLLARGNAVLGAAVFRRVVDVVDLDKIVVVPQARRQGIARELLDRGLDWAESQGASAMMLEVEATNLAALELYRSRGFRELARRENYYGTGRDAVVMQASWEGKQP